MKLRKFTFTALAAFAALALSTVASRAAITYSSGDVFLGFRSATNTTNDFLVNIGAGSALRDRSDLGTPIVFTLSNINSTLTTLFGAGWATNPNVTFALIGTTQNTANLGDPIRTIYASEPIGAQAPINVSNQSAPATLILSMKNYYQSLPESAVPNGTIGSVGDSNSFTSKVTTSFGTSNLSPIEGTVTGGLELYRVPQTTAGAVTDEGSFTYTGGNTFTFTPTAVPEPSTAALGGLVILGLAFRRHRKSVLA